MLYQISNGTVSVGGELILSHIDFEIRGNEKIAVVGKNGAGKTTLLNLVAGKLSLDRDDRREGRGYGVRAGSPLGCFPSRPLRTGTGPWRRSFWRHVPAGIPLKGNGLNMSVSTTRFYWFRISEGG